MADFQEKNMALNLKINSFKPSIFSPKAIRLATGFLFAIVMQIVFILFLCEHFSPARAPTTSGSVSVSSRPRIEAAVKIVTNRNPICEHGKVYVYDLPPMLNKELLDNCQELNPWTSRCDAMSNGGFGLKATGLETVVPKNLTSAWYWTDMYNGEVIYHMRMLNYKCRTMDPLEATAFYIPFYASLSFNKYATYNFSERDRHGEMVLNWLKDQPSWKRANGSDHFIMLGSIPWDFRRREDDDNAWGTKFVYMPLMRNLFRLSIEKLHWEKSEVSVPYPTAFHPRTDNDLLEWQRYVSAQKRNSLFCFVGAERKKLKNDFRGLLMEQCMKEVGSCRVLDCSKTPCYDGAPQILETLLDSEFCLQPRGEGMTRRSFFDCMLAGSIPVYFWNESFVGQYQWHLDYPSNEFSVFIHRDDLRNGKVSSIRRVLEGFSREEVRKMRAKVIEMIPRIVYGLPNEGLGNTKDAFDISIEGVFKALQQKRTEL